MKTLSFIKKYSLWIYFSLTFIISWGAVLILIALNGFPASMDELNAQLPIAIVAMLLGPSISGLLMIGLVHGRAGYRDLLSRLLKWRVGIGWYAAALLIGPLSMMIVLFLFTRSSPEVLPAIFSSGSKGPILLSGLFGGLMVGIFEEIGWTGFAVPRLKARASILATGLFVGVLWGAWHILSNDIWGMKIYTGPLDPILYVTIQAFGFLVGQLPPYRILMVWVYDRTGSLLVVILMHAVLTATSLILAPQAAPGTPLLLYNLSLTIATWAVAAVIYGYNQRLFRQQPAFS
jgi:uncharacterized protein